LADRGVGSSLRRLCAPTGALVALCLAFAVSATAATPSPDPPPQPAPPKAQPVQPTVTVVVRQAPVVTPAPVVKRSTPVAKAPVQRVKPKAAPAPAKVAAKRVAKPKASKPAPVVRPPHDRNRVPLVAFTPAPSPAADSIDRDLLALAGLGLLLVALGGAVVLFAARRQLALAVLGVLALVAFVPAAGQAAPPYAPVPTCSPGPADCSAWHTGDVSVSWQYEPGWTAINCNSLPVLTDTNGVDRTCSVSYGPNGTDTYARTVTVKRDATPPQITGANPSRAPDSNGWFNHSLSVAFSGSDATSGIASCTNPSYGGGDSASVSVSGSCSDAAGNSSSGSFGFKYDATPPAVTASPDRKPDRTTWYRKPVTFSFAGTDLTSGIAACSAPTEYKGPDVAEASIVGSCRDAAGNVAEAGQAFQYDATAPTLPVAKAEVVKGVAKIVWQRSSDAVLVELERSPGINGRKKTIVYQGNGVSFTDKTVREGVRYRYEIRASDVAGNMVQKAVTAEIATPALYKPATGAAVRAPLVLAWEAVKGATFYNVQLYRNGKKVLTFWPKTATFRVGKTWRYAGKLQRLERGRYNWYVWDARGTRAKPRYGKLLGSNTFIVK
jgi:hypothetical protein